MEIGKYEVEVKLVRLRDIVLHHLHKQNPNVTLGDIEDLHRDIKVYMKNFLLTLDEMDAVADVKQIGDNDKNKEALQCD